MNIPCKTVIGIEYTYVDGVKHKSWQMVSEATGYAMAVLDMADNTIERFMFGTPVEAQAKQWRDSILAEHHTA